MEKSFEKGGAAIIKNTSNIGKCTVKYLYWREDDQEWYIILEGTKNTIICSIGGFASDFIKISDNNSLKATSLS